MPIQCSESQNDKYLTSTPINALLQYPYMTEGNGTIHSTSLMDAQSKDKNGKAKDATADAHDKSREFSDITTAIIYTDSFGIEKKIDVAAFNSKVGGVNRHHLRGQTRFNVLYIR